MQRYFILISYKGTGYSGWQMQPNGTSIQQELNRALSTFCQQPVCATGAGRTDAGVHASYFVAHFDLEDRHKLATDHCIYQLNGILPPAIAVHAITPVGNKAHARFSAISRTYEYRISRVKDPFLQETSYYYHGALDLKVMTDACEILKKYNDFRSFSRLHSSNKTDLCTISNASWTEKGSLMMFSITADRFLRNMVRAIVGTMLELGRKKISLSDFENIILGKERSMAGPSAPPEGLFLTHIDYPAGIYPVHR